MHFCWDSRNESRTDPLSQDPPVGGDADAPPGEIEDGDSGPFLGDDDCESKLSLCVGDEGPL